MSCKPPDIDWPDCPVPEGKHDFLTDTLGWTIASVLQNAAECIAMSGPCPEAHFNVQSDRDGNKVYTVKGGGVVIGEPLVDPECCGAIATGIIWPLAPRDGKCVQFTELEFRVKITWCCDTAVYPQMIDQHRIDRHLINIACCKLKAVTDEHTPKFDLKIIAYNSVDEDGVCDMLTFTVKATR